eukprot:365021-Chlamydomonas_euryale.AAC.3
MRCVASVYILSKQDGPRLSIMTIVSSRAWCANADGGPLLAIVFLFPCSAPLGSCFYKALWLTWFCTVRLLPLGSCFHKALWLAWLGTCGKNTECMTHNVCQGGQASSTPRVCGWIKRTVAMQAEGEPVL